MVRSGQINFLLHDCFSSAGNSMKSEIKAATARDIDEYLAPVPDRDRAVIVTSFNAGMRT
jgi:hypothetical protein